MKLLFPKYEVNQPNGIGGVRKQKNNTHRLTNIHAEELRPFQYILLLFTIYYSLLSSCKHFFSTHLYARLGILLFQNFWSDRPQPKFCMIAIDVLYTNGVTTTPRAQVLVSGIKPIPASRAWIAGTQRPHFVKSRICY